MSEDLETFHVWVGLTVQSTSQDAAEAEVQKFMEKQLRLWFNVSDEQPVDAEFREIGQGEVSH